MHVVDPTIILWALGVIVHFFTYQFLGLLINGKAIGI